MMNDVSKGILKKFHYTDTEKLYSNVHGFVFTILKNGQNIRQSS